MLKKPTSFLLLLPFLFISFQSFSPTLPALKRIIIDPGHGGFDGGAAGLHSTEAKICLELALKAGKMIEESIPGVEVLFTRTTDIMPGNKSNLKDGLRYRADFANSSGADLFISIHCNSAGKKAGGWNEKRIVGYDTKETWKGKGKKKRKVTTKVPIYEDFWVENHTSGTESFVWTAKENAHKESLIQTGEFSSTDSLLDAPENDPALNALKMIYAKKYFIKSMRLADLVQKEFEKRGRVNRGVKQRNDKGIWVLHATGMPSILIEAGFITNKEEEDYLNSEKGQMEIAEDITNAVKQYVLATFKGGNESQN